MSWLFPKDADHLARARSLMAEGRYEKARSVLMQCKAPEADALYDECSTHIDKADREIQKKALVKNGFRGWKVEVETKNARVKKELEDLVAKEIAKSKVDLSDPEVDQDAVKAAVTRAQRKATRTGRDQMGTVRLVPIMAAARK